MLVVVFFFAQPVFERLLMPNELNLRGTAFGGTGVDSSAPYFVLNYGHYRNALTLELRDSFVQVDGRLLPDSEVYDKVVGMLSLKKYDVLVLLVSRTEKVGAVVSAAGTLRRLKGIPVVFMYDSR